MNLNDIFLNEISEINKNIDKASKNLDIYTKENICMNNESEYVLDKNKVEEGSMLSLSDELRIMVKEKLKKKLLIEFISRYSNGETKLDSSTLDDRIKQFELLYGNAPFDEDEDEDKDVIVIFGQNFILDYVIRKPINEQKEIYFNAILESLTRQGFTREQISEGLNSLSSQLYNLENSNVNVR